MDIQYGTDRGYGSLWLEKVLVLARSNFETNSYEKLVDLFTNRRLTVFF